MAASVKTSRREKDRMAAGAKMADTNTTPHSPSSPDFLGEVSAAVAEALSTQFAALHEKMDALQTSAGALGGRVQEAEERIGRVEDSLETASQELTALKAQVLAQSAKIDDLENRSRRNNLRLLGIPETIVDKELKRYVENLLPRLFEGSLGSGDLLLERVHRVGSRQARDSRPRIVLAKFLQYPQKEAILRAARQRNDLTCDNFTLRIAQDYSASLSQRRRAYAPLCTRLLAAAIKFSVQYPARLHIFSGGAHRVFDSAEEAASYVERITQERSPPASSAGL